MILSTDLLQVDIGKLLCKPPGKGKRERPKKKMITIMCENNAMEDEVLDGQF